MMVYKILCNDCVVCATHISQTKLQLKTRIVEHQSDIKKK